MLFGKSQVSIEYLILTGFVILVFIVPLVSFLYSTASGTVQKTVAEEQAVELGGGIVNDAKQIYYLGLYSRKHVTYQVPQNVEKMYIADIIDQGKHHYYFAIKFLDSRDMQKYLFESSVPMMSVSDGTDPNIEFVGGGGAGDIAECATFSCSFYYFRNNVIKPGRKGFMLETRLEGSVTKVLIIPD